MDEIRFSQYSNPDQKPGTYGRNNEIYIASLKQDPFISITKLLMDELLRDTNYQQCDTARDLLTLLHLMCFINNELGFPMN